MNLIFTYIKTLLISGVFIYSCKSDPAAMSLQKEKVNNPIFLDSIEASHAIIDEDIDGMLKKINRLDISIQMKRTEPFYDIEEARQAYRSFLTTQVENFDSLEISYMTEVFSEVNARLTELNPDLILPQIKLVKIKLDHYGPDVYYTRGKVIFLPKNSLKGRSTKGQINIMLHEVWHIISRYYPSLKDEAYKLIGFNKFNHEIKYDSLLSERLLINPDGVNIDHCIDLGNGITALPVVRSSRNQYDPTNSDFFNYIYFDLYAVDASGNVLTNNNGGSTIPAEQNVVFFEKIKDNTQYIIHPDEIIADNFMLSVNAYYTHNFDQFSKQGLKLVQDLIQILKKHKR